MNRFKIMLLASAMCAAVATPTVAHDVDLEVDNGRLSYTLGVQFGSQILEQLRRVGAPLNGEVLAQAISDLLTTGELKLTDEEMQAALTEFAEQQTRIQEELREMITASGEQFQAEFSAQPDVKSTESGLLYRVMVQGDGETPTEDSTVTVHYRGMLTDGTEFDSSYRRNEPTSFGVTGVIPGWTEMLQLMNVGSKVEVVIPPGLAYGERGAGAAIPPGATLVFEIELLAVE